MQPDISNTSQIENSQLKQSFPEKLRTMAGSTGSTVIKSGWKSPTNASVILQGNTTLN
jgi:hypothetical protein